MGENCNNYSGMVKTFNFFLKHVRICLSILWLRSARFAGKQFKVRMVKENRDYGISRVKMQTL